MAGSLSDYAELKLLDHVLGTAAYAKPTVYLALFTVAPGEAGGGTEVSGGAYTRQAVAFTAAAAGATANTADVTFPTATASWGTVVAVGIMDASTAGNLLAFSTLAASKVIGSGDVLKVAAGALTVSLD